MEVTLIIILLLIFFPIIWSYAICILSTNKKIKRQKEITSKDFSYTTIICAHNEELTIDKILTSLNNQTYKNNSIFVVLDNCTDNTKSIINKYKYVNIIEKNTPSTCKGDALNYGIKYLKKKDLLNDIILVLDADASIDNNLLEKLNTKYKEGSRVVMPINKVSNPYDNLISMWYATYWAMVDIFSRLPHTKLNLSSNLCGCGMSMKKEYLTETKTITEDVEYFFILSNQNIKIDYLNDSCTYQEQPITIKDMYHQLRRWTSGLISLNKYYLISSIKSLIKDFNIIKLDSLITNEVCMTFSNLFLFSILVLLLGIFINKKYLIYFLLIILTIFITLTITAYRSIKKSGYNLKKMLIAVPTYFIFIIFLAAIYNYSRIIPNKKWYQIKRKDTI